MKVKHESKGDLPLTCCQTQEMENQHWLEFFEMLELDDILQLVVFP